MRIFDGNTSPTVLDDLARLTTSRLAGLPERTMRIDYPISRERLIAIGYFVGGLKIPVSIDVPQLGDDARFGLVIVTTAPTDVGEYRLVAGVPLILDPRVIVRDVMTRATLYHPREHIDLMASGPRSWMTLNPGWPAELLASRAGRMSRS